MCDLLGEPVVPATLRAIRLYTAVCNNAVTLRGHLAAWKLLHTIMGSPWHGEQDPFIRAAHAGILRWQPRSSPRQAIRIDLALRIVICCFGRHVILIWCHVFHGLHDRSSCAFRALEAGFPVQHRCQRSRVHTRTYNP